MNLFFTEIKIEKAAVNPLIAGHPWIYRKKIIGTPKSQWVYIKLDKTYYGIFEPIGPIAVRIVSENKEPCIELFSEKISKLYEKRKESAETRYDSNAFRCVHGEADGFPGLTIDVYGSLIVTQPYLKTWEDLLPYILKGIMQKSLNCYVKIPKQRGEGKTGYFIGTEIKEDFKKFSEKGMSFASFYATGQKSGFYLDLRELRKQISKLELNNKKVLDLFASDGALSTIITKKGALLKSVEISRQCQKRAKINFELNKIEFNEKNWIIEDVWTFIKREKQTYDLIIVDPPNLATSKDQIDNSIRAWKQLNNFALEHINAQGTIISCNCSARLTKDLHKKTIMELLKKKKIQAKNFYFLQNTFDHPVSDKIPELNYLDISIVEL